MVRLEIGALFERRLAAIEGCHERGTRNEGPPPCESDYLVIRQVIKDDPKLLQAVSRELIAQGALTSVGDCLKIVDQSDVATEKPKAMVEDEKQLHPNFITWEGVPPVHYEFWFDRVEASLSKAALVKVWKLAKPVKIQFCKQLFAIHHWQETPAEGW